MKRSLDSMLETTTFSQSQQQQPHLELSIVYEADRVSYGRSERQKILENWISDYDPLLLSDDQHYGEDGKTIGLYIGGVIANNDCSPYYAINISQRESDILLCRGVCPVFILHGIASILQQEPLSNGHISYYWQFILHILKTKLVAANKPIGPFISRLFDLVYTNGFTPYDIPEVYLNIITIFLHENLHFMIKRDPPHPGAKHYYIPATEAIEKPESIVAIVANNLFPSYFIPNESHLESINTSGQTSQNEATALWNKYQLDRGTMREMQLFTGNQCPMPQKKVREALKTVRFSDVVDTFYHHSHK